MDWDTDWMLEEDDNKDELMHLNKNIKLPRKMPEPLQSCIDGIIRAYDEGNMGMYVTMEDCIEPEAKKMLLAKKISKEEKNMFFAMLGWYVE